MKKATVFLVLLVAYAGAQTASTDDVPMFLCVDSMAQLKKGIECAPPKLVYGYIDGRKTACMSENMFRERHCKRQFEQSRAAEVDSQKILEQRGLRRKVRPGTLLELVYRGKKNLAAANLQGSDLRGMNLSGADLRDANLESADLRNSNLKGANLSGANLESAYLKGADLRGADLSGAKMKNCYFHLADLREAQGLYLENIRFVRTIFRATLDEDILLAVKENCPAKLQDPGWRWEASNYSSNALTEPEPNRADPKQFR